MPCLTSAKLPRVSPELSRKKSETIQPEKSEINPQQRGKMSKRKTTAEKQLAGTYRQDRDKPRAAFSPSTGAKVPVYLGANLLAVEEWERVVPSLEAEGILRETDLSLLATYCL